MTFWLSVAFFLSGASAVVFETLWFRAAGLLLGNGIWASSLVMAGFMAGLALGSVFAARLGDRARSPLRVFAALEAIVAAASFALVLALPAASPAISLALRPLGAEPSAMSLARLLISFAAVVVPATAMGATLPVLARALASAGSDYGRVVGQLYGWNTLGGVLGALAGETILVPRFGVFRAACAGACCDAILAVSALALSRRVGRRDEGGEGGSARLANPARILMGAAFFLGALLLVLEVVWFRFLLLFSFATSLAFAVLLATVLAGIGAGSLASAALLHLRPSAHEHAPAVAALAGVSTIVTYAAFLDVSGELRGRYLYEGIPIALAAGRLMLPTSFLSGALFVFLAKRLREEVFGEARAAALLTLANTVGAALGAFSGGFLLLRGLGVEGSLAASGLGYGLTALGLGTLPPRREKGVLGSRLTLLAAGAALLASLAAFPFGLMRNRFLPAVTGRWAEGGRIVAFREEASETLTYTSTELFGEPVFHRLIVNGFSMSASTYSARRYMNLFVYLPLALHPAPRRALVICYGLGSTAKALTDTSELREIDVVDTSKDILEMGRVVLPPPSSYPLDDPRVATHVEDGRFFLQTTDKRWDVITGEPPPPKNAGVSNLYSREYFRLVHDHLTEGGIASYWLPVWELEVGDARALVGAFCDAFQDCSLWTGYGYEWILLGSREGRGPGSGERLKKQWRDPVVGTELRGLGVETPDQLGSSFLGDRETLREFVGGAPDLDDDHPGRISARFPYPVDPFYARFMDAAAARERFRTSSWIEAVWPAAFRESTLRAFEAQSWINALALRSRGTPLRIDALAGLLTRTSLKTPVYWFLGSSAKEQQIAARAAARGSKEPLLKFFLGIEDMANRDFLGANAHLAEAPKDAGEEGAEGIMRARALALCLAGRRDDALAVAAGESMRLKDPAAWSWIRGECDEARSGPAGR